MRCFRAHSHRDCLNYDRNVWLSELYEDREFIREAIVQLQNYDCFDTVVKV